ncbi:glycosyl transferase [Paenibacillus polymyxa]|uniref:bifunctional glycosyltransferase family 2 protein/class I SAM-dependent methyltransferase n=1 Tax=Paenibacillus polymyxa TaxID=1406 RepID=UPI001F567733|nr:bifunctional glycosyltransferase family 2 protein/class I SAM-dependent methyltransferase [Paenibacillus polymyxa]UNL94672.1 glycosyl transferase [Paenibacillus polymyxa]
MLSSIIILTYNKLDYTKECIESIRNYTDQGTYEIIVVDNASNDGTQEWIQSQDDIFDICNESNLGFPKGCNQGIDVAQGDNIVLLNNDVVVTPGWLDILLNALYSSEDNGAVGPVTNSASNYQTVPVAYQSKNEMLAFATKYNRPDNTKWEQRLRLIGFCMVIKREVVDKVGLLDEMFSPGNYEDDDYSCRINQSGYKLILCKDVFIHHYGSISFGEANEAYTKLLEKNKCKFEEKWNFKSEDLSNIRRELSSLIEQPKEGQIIRVLEVNCGCGGTLLEIKNKIKNVELFGLEANEFAAAFACEIAEVRIAGVEEALNYPENYFDYIILSNTFEKLRDPWGFLRKLKMQLKQNGKILASIYNVMHFSAIRSMLNGQWSYTDNGLLAHSHIRFFSLYEIDKMFTKAGFEHMEYQSIMLPISDRDQSYIENLSKLGNHPVEQYKTYQYVVKALNNNEKDMLQKIILRLENENYPKKLLTEFVNLITINNITYVDIINEIDNSMIINKQTMYNTLGTALYKADLFEHVFPLFYASYELNKLNKETLYNIGFLLYKAGDNNLSLHYLRQIEDYDPETAELIKLIQPC